LLQLSEIIGRINGAENGFAESGGGAVLPPRFRFPAPDAPDKPLGSTHSGDLASSFLGVGAAVR